MNGVPERANYVASLGYYMEDGILQNTDFSRYTGRVGADSQAKSWLKIGMNANFAHSESSYQSFEDASTSNVWYTAQFMAPGLSRLPEGHGQQRARDADRQQTNTDRRTTTASQPPLGTGFQLEGRTLQQQGLLHPQLAFGPQPHHLRDDQGGGQTSTD